MMDKPVRDTNSLGNYLRDRRAKLDPAAFGFSAGRRRTPGLRREEVAQRANISPAWYTWLEQGRGGAPSADVLDRIARALMLTDIEREHLFLLGLGHRPEVRFQKSEGVAPRLQRVLDALDPSPALVRNASFDIVAWNRATAVMLFDYGSLPPEERNILRITFLDPRARDVHHDWESMARFVVGAFRVEAARAGATAAVAPLVEELSRLSPEFRTMWRDNDIHSQSEGIKHLDHPTFGPLSLEYSAFAVDGRPDLTMVVFNLATPDDTERMRAVFQADRAATASCAAL
jgi:transcriptional regulator with XRE-family HTH domain